MLFDVWRIINRIFFKQMNSEVKSAGVRLNVVCPAFVDTDLIKEIDDGNCLDVQKAHKFIEMIGVVS